jgi:hypothetical protein
MNNGHQEDLACSIILKLLESRGATRPPPLLAFGGYGYRSTGQNINGPNINELQINCSIDQR